MTTTAQEKSDVASAASPAVSDADLLRSYVRDHSEQAFQALVERHGSLVMGVCLRVLAHQQDAEDAFQAAFVVLARRASGIRKRDSVAAWLYGVAYRVSVDVARRRHRGERSLAFDPMQTEDPFSKLESEFDRQVVDEELQRLPKPLRVPLVLFYLGGKTSREIAEELGESQGTIDGRLKRGRQKLRVLLTKRGVAMAGLLSVICVSAEHATAAVSPALVNSTVSLGLSAASGTIPTASAGSSEVLQFAGREIFRMSVSKPVTIGLSLALFIGAAALCANAMAGQPQSGSSSAASGTLDTRVGEAPPAVQIEGIAEVTPTNAVPDASPGGGRGGLSQAERIAAALDGPTEDIQGGESFKTILDFLQEHHNIPIIADRRNLSDEGIESLDDVMVHEELRLPGGEMKLRSVLDLLLGQIEEDLDYIVHNEVLLITTGSVADAHRETRIYELAEDVEPAELIDFIQNTFQLNEEDGCHVQFIGRKLCVTHNQRTLKQLENLMKRLDIGYQAK